MGDYHHLCSLSRGLASRLGWPAIPCCASWVDSASFMGTCSLEAMHAMQHQPWTKVAVKSASLAGTRSLKSP